MQVGYIDALGNARDNKLQPYGKKILDTNGDILFESDEKLFDKIHTGCSISTKWKDFLSQLVFEGSEGNLYLTNKRMIFINNIDPRSKFSGGFGIPSSIVRMAKARELKTRGVKEYFEVKLDEIAGVNLRKDGLLSIQLLVGTEKYHISVYPSERVIECLEKLPFDK